MVVHLNSPGRAAVGVAVKPPDESFRRLETARPNPPLYLSVCVLYAAPILGEGARQTGVILLNPQAESSFVVDFPSIHHMVK